MRTANLSSQATRMSDVGLVWKLLNNNASTSHEVSFYSTLFIYAVADCVVSIDGIQSVKIMASNSMIINVGNGNTADNKRTVKIEFSAAVNLSIAN